MRDKKNKSKDIFVVLVVVCVENVGKWVKHILPAGLVGGGMCWKCVGKMLAKFLGVELFRNCWFKS